MSKKNMNTLQELAKLRAIASSRTQKMAERATKGAVKAGRTTTEILKSFAITGARVYMEINGQNTVATKKEWELFICARIYGGE